MNAHAEPAATIEPDPGEIATFCEVVFTGLEGFVPVRRLQEKGGNDARTNSEFLRAGPDLIDGLIRRAGQANYDLQGLFAVPGTVAKEGSAKAADITQMASIVVDLDAGDIDGKREHLERHLGPASLVVASGGVTEEGQSKLHLHWRIDQPVHGPEVQRLCALRGDIARRVGGDGAFASAHQPIRVPGSIHAKYGIRNGVRILASNSTSVDFHALTRRAHAMPVFGKAEAGTFAPVADRRMPHRGLLTMRVHEGARDGISRFEALSSIIGHWVRCVRLGEINPEEAWEAVRNHNAALISPPWDETRLRREFDSLRAVDAANHPIDAQGRPPVGSEDAISADFVRSAGRDWRFVPSFGQWKRWTGTHWADDEAGAIGEAIRLACRQAAKATEGAAGRRIASYRTISAVRKITETAPEIVTVPDDWDNDPMLLNTPDGILHLSDGSITSADRSAMMSRIAGARPSGNCERWKGFLQDVTGGDDDLVRYLARVCGYCLTGSTSEQVFFFLHGHGANGKSVFVSTVSAVLGSYATTAPLDAFMSSRSDRHPTDLAGLTGARLVTVNETEANRSWAEARIKAITGGEMISARFMHRDFFQYRPGYKLIIAGNHLPSLSNSGEAMKRRLHIVPFAVTIPPGRRDKHLADRLLEERDGILAWMVDGCIEWQRVGLTPPKTVVSAAEDYFHDEDVVGEWIRDCCETAHNQAHRHPTCLRAGKNGLRLVVKSRAHRRRWVRHCGNVDSNPRVQPEPGDGRAFASCARTGGRNEPPPSRPSDDFGAACRDRPHTRCWPRSASPPTVKRTL